MNSSSSPVMPVPPLPDNPAPDPASDVFARIVMTTQSMLGWCSVEQGTNDAPVAPRRKTLTSKPARNRRALDAGRDGHA